MKSEFAAGVIGFEGNLASVGVLAIATQDTMEYFIEREESTINLVESLEVEPFAFRLAFTNIAMLNGNMDAQDIVDIDPKSDFLSTSEAIDLDTLEFCREEKKIAKVRRALEAFTINDESPWPGARARMKIAR